MTELLGKDKKFK
jgi:hypothetical protein